MAVLGDKVENVDYAGPIAVVVAALVGAIASYLTQRSEHVRASQELEIMERLQRLATRQGADQLASRTRQALRNVTYSLSRRTNRWEYRSRQGLEKAAFRLALVGVTFGAVLQVVYVSAFGPDPGFSDSMRDLLRQAWNVSIWFATAMAVLAIVSISVEIGRELRIRLRERRRKNKGTATVPGPLNPSDDWAI